MSRIQYALFMTVLGICFVIACNTADSKVHLMAPITNEPDTAYKSTLRVKGAEAKAFCKQRGMDTTQCFLLHFGRHSGYHRFYVWDMQTQSAIDSGLVSHGCGESSWGVDGTADAPLFSNTPDSHLSSIGRYRIGKRGYSQWGINVNYLMHGLDSTNDKALSRAIVLHSWGMMSDVATYPQGSPEGWGCPAVSNAFMTRLDTRLQAAEKPLLMWIFTE